MIEHQAPESRDLSQAATYNPSFITASGGTVGGALNALIAGLDASTAYFNIHTTEAGGGEIRGALVPVPAAAFLFAPAIAGLLMRRKERT